jgi:predicted dienelactone hydrolase
MRRAIAGIARALAFAGALLAIGCRWVDAAASAEYARTGPYAVESRLAEWTDARRQRLVPVKVYGPADAPGELPIVLFSHGLGGSREGGRMWAEHWASHGYLVVCMQHPGSDEGLWSARRGEPREAFRALKSGATALNALARMQDVKFVVDEIARQKEASDPMLGRANLARIGLSGHSFGSQTTLAAVGQRFVRASGAEPMLMEPRVRAAIAFSPNGRSRAGDPGKQFGSIRVPLLSVTGTRDGDVIGDGTRPADRTKPFEHMTGPGKYLVVFKDGDHMVFGGHDLRRKASPRDQEIQAGVKAVTLAFWDAWLKDDVEARRWLAGDGARSIFATGDRYAVKD